MQRQLYPAFLLITIALAAAMYLRPTVGEELMALAGVQNGHGLPSPGQNGLPAQATVFPSHHGGFLGGEHGYAGQPEAFARKLREVLDDARCRAAWGS